MIIFKRALLLKRRGQYAKCCYDRTKLGFTRFGPLGLCGTRGLLSAFEYIALSPPSHPHTHTSSVLKLTAYYATQCHATYNVPTIYTILHLPIPIPPSRHYGCVASLYIDAPLGALLCAIARLDYVGDLCRGRHYCCTHGIVLQHVAQTTFSIDRNLICKFMSLLPSLTVQICIIYTYIHIHKVPFLVVYVYDVRACGSDTVVCSAIVCSGFSHAQTHPSYLSTPFSYLHPSSFPTLLTCALPTNFSLAPRKVRVDGKCANV